MEIKEALRETGKAEVKDYGDGWDISYAKIHGDKGTLYWFDKVTNEEKGPVAFHIQHEEVWQPYRELKEIRPEVEDSWDNWTRIHPKVDKELVKDDVERIEIATTVAHGEVNKTMYSFWLPAKYINRIACRKMILEIPVDKTK